MKLSLSLLRAASIHTPRGASEFQARAQLALDRLRARAVNDHREANAAPGPDPRPRNPSSSPPRVRQF
jgi:hypothetical protein